LNETAKRDQVRRLPTVAASLKRVYHHGTAGTTWGQSEEQAASVAQAELGPRAGRKQEVSQRCVDGVAGSAAYSVGGERRCLSWGTPMARSLR
jgi:hypothetical protein